MKPSVTELLDMLNKPALMKWANKIGLEGTDLNAYRNKVKAHGTDMHNDIERYVKTKELPEDKALADKIVKFFADKEVIDVEQNIETEYFVGRYDIKLKWNDFIMICDFKRSSKVYFENRLQLAAYKMASPCDHVAVIHTKEFLVNPVTLTPDYEEFLITLSKLYVLRQKIN